MPCSSPRVRLHLPKLPNALRPTKAKLRWVGIRALIATVATYVGYLVVINLLLSTGLGKKILNQVDPTHANFDWDSAYSVWFAQVHTKGFVVRGTDTAVEWRITTDEASTSFGITDFFRRRVHMHGTTAKGISVRVRFKVTAPTADYLAKLPPIEGLPDPPIKPPEKPPLTDENYNLWSVEIDDIAADDIREVWIDTVRFTDAGGGSVVGAFYFKPMRIIRIDPTEYTARLGKVETGAAVIATDIHGTFGVHVAEFDPRVPTGNAAFAYVDASAVAVAKLVDLTWTGPFVGPDVMLSGGGGPLEVSARIRQGVLEPGSRLELRSEAWTAWVGRHWFSGTSLVHARVPQKTPAVSQISIESFDFDVHHDKALVAHAPAMNVAATFENTDLAASFEEWKAHVDMASANAPNLAAFNGYGEGKGLFYGGSAGFSVHGDADPSGVSGKFHAKLSNLSMQAVDAVAKGNGTVDLTLRYLDYKSLHADFSLARFEFHDVAAAKEAGYWINASASPFKVSFQGGPTLQATISGKARDAKLPLAIVGAPGIVATLAGNQSFTFSTGVRVTPTITELSNLRLIGDTVDIYGHYRADGKGKNGSVLVSTAAVNVGIEIQKGSISVRPFASQGWYAQTGS